MSYCIASSHLKGPSYLNLRTSLFPKRRHRAEHICMLNFFFLVMAKIRQIGWRRTKKNLLIAKKKDISKVVFPLPLPHIIMCIEEALALLLLLWGVKVGKGNPGVGLFRTEVLPFSSFLLFKCDQSQHWRAGGHYVAMECGEIVKFRWWCRVTNQVPPICESPT